MGNQNNQENVMTDATVLPEVQKVLEIFNNKYSKQVILYGPPGTSKTYSSILIASNFLQRNTTTESMNMDIDAAEDFLAKGGKDYFSIV